MNHHLWVNRFLFWLYHPFSWSSLWMYLIRLFRDSIFELPLMSGCCDTMSNILTLC